MQHHAPSPVAVNQPQTARITKEPHFATGAPLWKAILKLTCLLFVGSKVKLLTLPSIPPSHSPHHGQAVLWVLYLHGLESFQAEEKSWFTVKAWGAVHAARVATLFTGRQWPYCSYGEKEGEEEREIPPLPWQSPTLVPWRGEGWAPSAFSSRANKACPLWTRWRCQKLLGRGVKLGLGDKPTKQVKRSFLRWINPSKSTFPHQIYSLL